jgi:hypothetical protein
MAARSPLLVVTDDEPLSAATLAAIDHLAWPARRARDLQEAITLAGGITWELILCDVRLLEGRQLPAALRAATDAETPFLPIARRDDLASAAAGHHPGRLLCPEFGATVEQAALLAARLQQAGEDRLLASARRLVSQPGRAQDLGPPPALAAALRLDGMYAHEPSLEQAAALVGQQENLAKQVLRLAHALAGDLGARPATLPRVLLDLGLLGFIPLVKIAAARTLFPVRDAGRAQRLHQLWRFGVGRALAMRALAGRSHPGVRADVDWHHAFDAGLFADAGAGLLIWLADQSQPRPLRALAATDAETALSRGLLAAHEWLGERLLERWRHARPVGVVAGGHHGGDGAGPDPAALRALALAAGRVLQDAGLGEDPTGPALPAAADRAEQHLHLDAAARGQIAAHVRTEIARIDEAVQD